MCVPIPSQQYARSILPHFVLGSSLIAYFSLQISFSINAIAAASRCFTL